LTDYQGEGKVLDITNTDSIKNLFDEIQSPSILVNNAGITRDSLFVRMKDDDWNAVIDANLSSVYRLSKAVLRPMTKARHGRIITITSIIGLTGNAGQTNYAAAKAGTIAFSKSLAKEVGSRNITVNTVAPGFIETDMTRGLIEKQQEAMLKNIPLNRIGNVNDIAAAVVFLASKASGYITGETIHVNGGMYMS
jgi:3-oxoacyl-[acyl-carrier protein] reductase